MQDGKDNIQDIPSAIESRDTPPLTPSNEVETIEKSGDEAVLDEDVVIDSSKAPDIEENDVTIDSSKAPCVDDVHSEDTPHDETVNYDINTAPPKEPLFKLEPRKAGCTRNDALLLLGKKIGFFGLVIFLLLSILFGAIIKIFASSLNLYFMALAVLSYTVENIIELVAISKCNCSSCLVDKKKKRLIIISTVLVAIVLIALGICKSLGLI